MTKLERYYTFLEAARDAMPKGIKGVHRSDIDHALNNAVDAIVVVVDPKSMSEIRSYQGPRYDDLLKMLLGSLLEKSPESEADGQLELHSVLHYANTADVLAAPIETPSDLARWLVNEFEQGRLSQGPTRLQRAPGD
jgi:hypothetical protein